VPRVDLMMRQAEYSLKNVLPAGTNSAKQFYNDDDKSMKKNLNDAVDI